METLRSRRFFRAAEKADARSSQERAARPAAAAARVEVLHPVLQTPQQERRTQQEEGVGDDGAGDGRLHEHVLPRSQRRERDDQLREVAERRVEQPAHGVARPGGHGLGGVGEQRRQRDDGEDREREEQRVGFRSDPLAGENDGDEEQQPQDGVATELLEEAVHGACSSRPGYPPRATVMPTSTRPTSVRPAAMRSALPPTIRPHHAPRRKRRLSATRFESRTARFGSPGSPKRTAEQELVVDEVDRHPLPRSSGIGSSCCRR